VQAFSKAGKPAVGKNPRWRAAVTFIAMIAVASS
jgi:hypothetical protein